MERIWDGITRSAAIKEEAIARRHALIDAAKGSKWKQVFAILEEPPTLWVDINGWRPDGKTWYTPLHHAAYNGAPVAVVQSLIDRGAWRTLRTAEGERAVDIAAKRKHTHLLQVLEPVYQRTVLAEALGRIQAHFHEVILSRARELVEQQALRLPELEPLLEFTQEPVWFAIPGMYGGFRYWLETEPAALLWSESLCRVAGGSGQHHVVSEFGSLLVDKGFV